jgi:hypothetical protein
MALYTWCIVIKPVTTKTGIRISYYPKVPNIVALKSLHQ